MKLRPLKITMISAVVLAGLSCSTDAQAEAPSSLRERQEKVQKVARQVSRSVVAIVPNGEYAKKAREEGEMVDGSGSGVIISEDGLIMTAAHVLQAVGDEFDVILHNGDRVKAKTLGLYRSLDAALGQIVEPGKYFHVPRAEVDQVKEGDWCIAMGHPGGYENDRIPPLRLGRVLETDVDGFLVSDCTLSGGDSGGPLFNLEGQVIGINSSIAWQLTENRHVPMDAFKNNWDRLMKEGEKWGSLSLNRRSEPRSKRDRSDDKNDGPKIESDPNPERPVLGIQLQESANGQPEIGRVELRAPARADGVKAGDVITKVNNTSTDKPEDVVKAVKSLKPGDKVKLTIERDGKTIEIETKVTTPKQLERE